MAQVKLTWTNGVTGETGIEVWRETVRGGAGALLTTLPPDTTTYTDPTPPLGTVFYRVRAISGTEQGAFTAWFELNVTAMAGSLSGLSCIVIP